MIRSGQPDQPRDELAGLADEARRADAEAAAAGQPGAPGEQPADGAPPPLTNAQCIAMGLQVIRETVAGLAKLDTPRQTLSDANCTTVGDAVGPVLDKYGIQLGAAVGDFAIELRAAMVAGPLLWVAYRAAQDELRARRAKPVEPEAAPAADPAPPADQPAP